MARWPAAALLWPAVAAEQPKEWGGEEQGDDGRWGKEREREWREQGVGSGSASPNDTRRRGGAQAVSARGHAAAASCARSDMDITVHQIQISNSTSKTRLNIHLCPFISPNKFSLGTNGSNKCCRAIWGLQLCLKVFGLTRIILEDIELQSRAHETENSGFSYLRLRIFLDSENISRFKVWASIWLSSKMIWLLFQKQSLFYSTQTSTFI